uniref:CSab-Cer-2 n=1 Tax=Cercophonius squama TaxID=1330404 RepID=T1DEJ4_9SCOR
MIYYSVFVLCLAAIVSEIGNVQGKKDGYPLTREGLKISCMIVAGNSFCDTTCKSMKSSYGYCYAFGCYCEGLPDDIKVWDGK